MKESTGSYSGVVFSTNQGRMCPDCMQPIADCRCREGSTEPLSHGHVRVSRETKGRKGKGVTLVTGLPLNDKGLQQLGKQLKRKCGAGGTVKNGTIEIQGEHRDFLVRELLALGYQAKRAGG